MPIDPAGAAAYGTAVNVPAAAQTGALAGLEIGQKQATINALQGVDLNSPSTVDTAIQGLIRAGSSDQANALMNLNISRSVNSAVLPAVIARLNPGSSADPNAPPASAGAATPATTPAPDVDTAMAQSQAMMGQAVQAVQQLQATPLDQRPAVAAQIKQAFLAKGVPEAAIDETMDDLSDAGLAKVGGYLQAHMAHVAGTMAPGNTTAPTVAPPPQGAPTAAPAPVPGQSVEASAQTAPDHPTGYAWADSLLHDPVLNDPLVQGVLKRSGIDISGQLDRAERMAMPGITAAATAAQAGPTELAKQIADIEVAPATIAIAAKQAGAVASAQEAAKAPYDFETVNGPNGQPVYVRKDFAVQYAGEHGGVLGQGITPAEQSFQTAQAGQAADMLKPDPVALQSAQNTQANAERALSIISNLRLDPTTPIKGQIAQALRGAGLPEADQYANDVAGFKALANQTLASATHDVFPSRTTNTDLKLMHDVIPNLTTPNDAAATAMGMIGAQGLRRQQIEEFKANYSGPHNSPDDIYKAWQAGPGGQSIFQSPEWGKVLIGGRPAFNPDTDVKTVNGKQIGAWGLGTGHPVYFLVH